MTMDYRCPDCGKRFTHDELISTQPREELHKCPGCGRVLHLCDICLKLMEDGEGYVLTTLEVVTTPAYWEFAFREAGDFARLMPEAQVREKLEHEVRRLCGQETGWMTCDECISRFPKVDKVQARAYAAEFWEQDDKGSYSPPGGGAVHPYKALAAANRAWKKVTGLNPPATRILPPDPDSETAPAPATEASSHVEQLKLLAEEASRKMQEKDRQDQLSMQALQIAIDVMGVEGRVAEAASAEMQHARSRDPEIIGEIAQTNRRKWQEWLNSTSEPLDLEDADLSGLAIFGIDLKKANLKSARFSDSDIYGCCFEGSSMEDACFDDATITRSDFSHCIMKSASFHSATLEKCRLLGADLTGTNFQNAQLTETHGNLKTAFTDASFEGAMFDDVFWKFMSKEQVKAIKGSSRCFIATACYGSPEAWQVVELIRFRDTRLLTSRIGCFFVSLYYRISPPVADFIRENPRLRHLVRTFLVESLARFARKRM